MTAPYNAYKIIHSELALIIVIGFYEPYHDTNAKYCGIFHARLMRDYFKREYQVGNNISHVDSVSSLSYYTTD